MSGTQKLLQGLDIPTLSAQDCATLVQTLVEHLGNAKSPEAFEALGRLLPMFGYAQPGEHGAVLQEVKMCGTNVVVQMILPRESAQGIANKLLEALQSLSH